jgi:RNA-directed DNA polymerase
VNWVLDADIRKFYDTLDQGGWGKFIEPRIADRRVVRWIQKWLKAGVREEGQRVQSEIGTVPGGSIRPLLSNLYLHYGLDLWVQRWRRKPARGEVIFVRFAEDLVAGLEHREEAERFLAERRERLARFGLPRHADQTRIVEFGRLAEPNRRNRGDGKPETFHFLGFTHSGGKTRKGHFTVLRQTMRQRWQAKLRALQEELRRRMHPPIREQGAYLRSVLLGHFRYYGVPMNGPALCAFRQAAGYLWRTVLRRRSQGNHLPWRRRKRSIARWFPPARVSHPYPLVRLGVFTQGGSRMR